MEARVTGAAALAAAGEHGLEMGGYGCVGKVSTMPRDRRHAHLVCKDLMHWSRKAHERIHTWAWYTLVYMNATYTKVDFFLKRLIS